MKINKLNFVILVGFLAIVGVIMMQLLLLKQAYLFEKKELEDKIHFALQDVVKKIYTDNQSDIPIAEQVNKITDSYYIVNVNDVFENTILEYYLKNEFSKVKLDLDFEYAIYNCGSDEMVYGNYIGSNGSSQNKCEDCFTKNEDLIYYFAIRFPKLEQNYFRSLQQYWSFTLVLFLVLVIYVYSVFLLLKQKRYSALQNDFINNMTHEFKTPLSSILIASNYANSQKEIADNSKLKKYIQIIIDQSNKLNQHIEQILSLAKSSSHQMKLVKKEVELYTVLELIQENLKLKHSKVFSLVIENNCRVILLADAFHFYNLLFNLLDNAVKYGKEPIAIKIAVEKNSQGINLVIQDNGPGIPEKDLPFVFDKFYRVKRKDSEEIEGFGIGLAYVKKIVELHHWKIKIINTKLGLQIRIEISKNDYYDA